MNTVIKSVLVFSILLLGITSAESQIIGVQFQGNGTALTQNQTAGVVPQDNYNVFSGETGTALALSDSTGSLTNATLTFSAEDEWVTGTGVSTPDNTLLSGKIGPQNSTASVTINNLAAGTYNLILYTMNDNAAQTGTFSVGATSFSIADQAGNAFDGTYIQGTNTDPSQAASDVANYLLFSDIVVTEGGSITFTSSHLSPAGTGAGAFNGFQLVTESVPEPSITALMIGGFVILGMYRMRKSFEKSVG